MLPALALLPEIYMCMVADTIGVLTEVSDAHMVQLPNKPQPTLTRHVILRDARYV